MAAAGLVLGLLLGDGKAPSAGVTVVLPPAAADRSPSARRAAVPEIVVINPGSKNGPKIEEVERDEP